MKTKKALYEYKLDDEYIEHIKKYYDDSDFEGLISFVEAVGVHAVISGWNNAKEVLKEVGEERFFKTCRNCGYRYECTPDHGCEDWYTKWIPEDMVTKVRNKDLFGKKE